MIGHLKRAPIGSIEWSSPEAGLRRRVLAYNAKLMVVEHSMDEGWAGARHSHPHDQAVYVVSGRLRFSCGEEEFEVFTGGSFVVKGGVEHQAWALEPSLVVDVFTPIREDFLDMDSVASGPGALTNEGRAAAGQACNLPSGR